MTVVWLLDVDGVINASRPSWGGAPTRRSVMAKGREWRISFAPDLITRIRRIVKAGQLEIRWCTTWCPDIVEIQKVTGLPPLRRCWYEEPGAPAAADSLKFAAAARVLTEGRRLVWTDGEIFERIPGALRRRLADPRRCLLLAPAPKKGLQPEHLDYIEAFAARETR